MITIALAGFLIGMLVGTVGVGGGTLLMPAMLYLGVPPGLAVGTDLVHAALTKITGGWQYFRQGYVHLGWVVWMAMGSVPAALLGTYAVERIRLLYGSPDGVLKPLIGVVLIVSGAVLVWREFSGRRFLKGRAHPPVAMAPGAGVPGKRDRLRIIGFAALTGFMVGATSIGSGTFFVMLLLFLSPLTIREIVGTDIAHAALLTLIAGIAHARLGYVDWNLTGNLLAGSLPGVWLGSRLVGVLPVAPLKLGLAFLVLATGLQLVWR